MEQFGLPQETSQPIYLPYIETGNQVEKLDFVYQSYPEYKYGTTKTTLTTAQSIPQTTYTGVDYSPTEAYPTTNYGLITSTEAYPASNYGATTQIVNEEAHPITDYGAITTSTIETYPVTNYKTAIFNSTEPYPVKNYETTPVITPVKEIPVTSTQNPESVQTTTKTAYKTIITYKPVIKKANEKKIVTKYVQVPGTKIVSANQVNQCSQIPPVTVSSPIYLQPIYIPPSVKPQTPSTLPIVNIAPKSPFIEPYPVVSKDPQVMTPKIDGFFDKNDNILEDVSSTIPALSADNNILPAYNSNLPFVNNIINEDDNLQKKMGNSDSDTVEEIKQIKQISYFSKDNNITFGGKEEEDMITKFNAFDILWYAPDSSEKLQNWKAFTNVDVVHISDENKFINTIENKEMNYYIIISTGCFAEKTLPKLKRMIHFLILLFIV